MARTFVVTPKVVEKVKTVSGNSKDQPVVDRCMDLKARIHFETIERWNACIDQSDRGFCRSTIDSYVPQPAKYYSVYQTQGNYEEVRERFNRFHELKLHGLNVQRSRKRKRDSVEMDDLKKCNGDSSSHFSCYNYGFGCKRNVSPSELLFCTKCRKSCHVLCHNPPLHYLENPNERAAWRCLECRRYGYRRNKRF